METIKNKLGIYKHKKIGIAGNILRFIIAIKCCYGDMIGHFYRSFGWFRKSYNKMYNKHPR